MKSGKIKFFWPNSYGFLLILLLLAGCETSVEFQTHDLPKLTIISQVSPNGWEEGQRVYVYASQSPSDSSQFYTPEELMGKTIIVIVNLAPATIAGEESIGMLLALDIDETSIALLTGDKDLKPGSLVR